jgi:allophanate hydrolase subunit 1
MSLYAQLAIVFAIFASGFASGFKIEHGRNAVERVTALENQAEIERAQHRAHDVDLSRVISASNNSNTRAAALSVDYDASRSDVDRLRSDIADFTAQRSTDTGDSHQRIIALGAVFQECSNELTTLARKADGHVNDIQTFIEAEAR